jgi:hypothetical protein
VGQDLVLDAAAEVFEAVHDAFSSERVTTPVG